MAGHRFTIPAHPASIWVALVVSDDQFGSFLDLLDDDDKDIIWEMILGGDCQIQDLNQIMLDTITLASGRDWWFTMKLLFGVQAAWDSIGGYLAIKGVRADQISFQAYMDAVLYAVLQHVKSEDQAMMMSKLKLPPPGQKIVLDEKKEADAFMAHMRGR